MTLSKLQKKQYKELVQAFGDNDIMMLDDKNYIRMRGILDILEFLGYVRNHEVDNTNMFQRIGNFSDFDEWHKDRVREERKMSAREWRIGIIGALIGLIPFIVTTVIPWVVSFIEK